MYPTLYHFFLDAFGVEWHWAKLLNSFGFFVAVAFIVASYVLSLELKRRETIGQFHPEKRRLVTGKGPDWTDIAVNALVGFFFGWKLVYLLMNGSRLFDGHEPAQAHLFSTRGYPLLGLLVAAAFGGWRYWYYRKNQLPEPKEEIIDFHIYEYTGTITFLAAAFGITGAKLFHLIENPREFVEFFSHPDLQSFLQGLTVYGGLILGSAGVLWFAWRKKIALLSLCDAAAPAMILGYGIGRIGCHVSGDGDWGITNQDPLPAWLSWLPEKLWAYDYPNNVNGVGQMLVEGPIYEGYGTHLVPPVFPTPIYETIMATAIFLLLWSLRKRIRIPGVIFGLYLMFNGMERFLIEKIRVNNVFEFLGMKMTQAELIAVLFFLTGGLMIVWLRRRHAAGGGPSDTLAG